MSLKVTKREFEAITGGKPPSRRHKYGVAVKEARTYQGIVFDSKAEMNDYIALRQLERAGRVRNLRRQVAYPLVVNGVRVATYRADFVYEEFIGLDSTQWVTVVQDTKGVQTEGFKIKQRLMFAVHGISIRLSRIRR